MTTIYTASLSFEPNFRFAANLAEASATIYLVDEDGELSPTQYQTADARHSVTEALRLALSACGEDYYVDPSDDRDADEQLAEIVEGADIESADTKED